MKRPKWAKCLSVRQWNGLIFCQSTNRPTLKRLREDIERQHAKGVTCFRCESAMTAIERSRA